MTRSQNTSKDLNEQRRRAVQLRLTGQTLAQVRDEVGLSTPTIVAAVKAFKAGGWAAVDVKPRGRPRRDNSDTATNEKARTGLLAQLLDNSLWSSNTVQDWLKKEQKLDVSLQTAANYLQSWNWLPENQQRQYADSAATATKTWLSGEYADFKAQAKNQQATLLWVSTRTAGSDFTQLYVHTLRGRCLWMCFEQAPTRDQYQQFFKALLGEFPNGIALVATNKNIETQAIQHSDDGLNIICALAPASGAKNVSATASPNTASPSTASPKRVERNEPVKQQTPSKPTTKLQVVKGHTMTQAATGRIAANDSVTNKHAALPSGEHGLTHLQRLEAESIQIMREVVANAENPVMMYSIGKDSAVMMHLARKAFYPAPPPFPLLHVDTTWKFQEMYRFRDNIVKEYGFELITHTNPEGLEKGVNPFTHGSALHTDIMKTEALKQALDMHKFDVALGGARRDEEKSRAKERIFSFRSAQHRWEPKNQRPELWNLFNTRKHPGESLRAFPLSNWTELDIWQYIYLQNIPMVPLYFAAERPVVERDGTLIMVDDDRMPLKDGEVPMMRNVRFRTLGCYPLTGAIESNATTLLDIIQETLLTKNSERQGRMIDNDSAASMEKKKQEGYF